MKKWSIVVVLSVVVLAANLACADPLYPSEPTDGDLPEAPYGGEAPNSDVGNSIRSEGVEAAEFIHNDGFASDEGIEVLGIIEEETETGDINDSTLSDAEEGDEEEGEDEGDVANDDGADEEEAEEADEEETEEAEYAEEGDEDDEANEVNTTIKSQGVEAEEFIYGENDEGGEDDEAEANEEDDDEADEVDNTIKSAGDETDEAIHNGGDEGEVPENDGGEAEVVDNTTLRNEYLDEDVIKIPVKQGALHDDGFEADDGVEILGIIEEETETGDINDSTLSDAEEGDEEEGEDEGDVANDDETDLPEAPYGGEPPEVKNTIRSEGVESDEFVE